MLRLSALIAGGTAVLLLGACGGSDDDVPSSRSAHAIAQLLDPGEQLDFTDPVTLNVRGGQMESVGVTSTDGAPLDGTISEDGTSWTSDTRPVPGASYDVAVTVSDQFGETHEFSDEFAVTDVPEEHRLTLAMQPSNESVVGVGAPIVVHFDQPVTEKAAVEQEMHVASDPQVVGSWHWVNDTQARFRPKEYWPAGSRVALDLTLNGVQAGEQLWGGRSYHLEFEVGEEHVAKVDADAYQMTVDVAGKRTYTWDTSLGAPEFATRNGTYIVLEKFDKRNMTSCNANITCDKSDPDYYDVDTQWSVRLTYSGTFVHSAPWSEQAQGEENVSHGCINLSPANAKTYFDLVRYGDIVTVSNSTRAANDLVQRGDPGMVDWNQSWSEYVSGSALGAEITTGEL